MSPDLALAIAAPAITEDHLRELLRSAAIRPRGTYGIGIEPVEYDGKPRRYRVVQYHWSGHRWHRFRKISGPKTEADIMPELRRAAQRLGHPIIGALELEHA
jgi:hypothetical protein